MYHIYLGKFTSTTNKLNGKKMLLSLTCKVSLQEMELQIGLWILTQPTQKQSLTST